MLDIRRLLQDEQYKKWFLGQPSLPDAAGALGPPWYVYLLTHEGKWARTTRGTYRGAFTTMKALLPQFSDIVIVSRRVAFSPPSRIVRITKGGSPVMVNTPTGPRPKTKVVPWDWRKLLDLEGGDRPHLWCPYCRRPTEFRYFPRHHAFKNSPVQPDPSRARCTVCGASEDLARNGARI